MSFRRFTSLLFKSAQLEEQIEREQRRRWPDWMRLLKLKKLRLLIKDRIQKMILEREGRQGKLIPVKVTKNSNAPYRLIKE